MPNIYTSDLAGAEDNKPTHINENFAAFDLAISEKITNNVTNTNALTLANIKNATLFILVIGSPAPTGTITLTVPSTDRGIIAIKNDTGFAVNVIISGQVSNIPQIKVAKTGLVYVGDTGCILISSGAEIVGTDVQAFDADLAAIAAIATTGILTRTAANTFTTRTITGTTPITITNGDGVSGNPTASIADAAITFAKLQNIATDTLVGRSLAGTGVAGSIPLTSAGRNLIDDVDAKAQRVTLDLPKPIEDMNIPTPMLDINCTEHCFGMRHFKNARTTTAYRINKRGIMELVPPETWRIGYFPNGTLRGYIFEDIATNICLWSEDLSNAAWTKVGTTIGVNTLLDPTLNTTMDKIIEDNATSEHKISQTITATVSQRHSVSFFAQASGRNFIKCRISNNGNTANFVEAVFNLSTGVVTSTLNGGAGLNVVAKIEETFNFNGTIIRRLVITGNPDTTGTVLLVEFSVSSDGTTFNYLGDNASGVGVWGVQVENMSSPNTAVTTFASATSYIPTTTVAVARGRDKPAILVLANNIPNLMIQKRISIYIEYSLVYVDTDQTILAVNNNTQNEQIDLLCTSLKFFRIRNGGSTILSGSSSAYINTNWNISSKLAIGLNGINANIYTDGVISGTSSAINFGTNLTHIELGARVGGGFGNFYLKRLMIFSDMLTNLQMEEMTRVNVE